MCSPIQRRLLGAMVVAAAIVAAWTANAVAADKTVLVVLAASSTRLAVLDAAAAFEKRHPDVTVQASFGGSKVLLAQLDQGAAGDMVLLGTAALLASPEGAAIFRRHHHDPVH